MLSFGRSYVAFTDGAQVIDYEELAGKMVSEMTL